MATMWITEFNNAGQDKDGQNIPVPSEPPVASSTVTFTTATASSAFNASTRFIRMIADANCHVAFGTAPTATSASEFLVANIEYYRAVESGHKVSVYDGAS